MVFQTKLHFSNYTKLKIKVFDELGMAVLEKKNYFKTTQENSKKKKKQAKTIFYLEFLEAVLTQ